MYEYLTGLIRVLEKRLPDKTDIDRMILAKTAQNAFDVLNDTDYADNLLNKKPEDYNQVLNDDFAQLKKLLADSIGNAPLFVFLFADFDFLNIKTALKKKLISDKGGIVSPKDFGSDNPLLKQSIINIIRKIKNKEQINSKQLDELADQELLNLKQQLAKKIKNKFINNLIKMQIDFLNTKILLRTYGIKLKTPFINGGLIDKNRLMHLYKADEQVLYVNLAELFELYGISHVIDEFKEKKDLWRLEKELDRRAFDFAHTASKSASYGPEVIVSYFLNKITGARNVRTILSGKLNGVGMEEIRERVII